MKRIPRATYRLQFNRGFTFQQANRILDYLDELGISDVYASPLFEAGPQSTHGYDVCSFGKVNSNLGIEQDFDDFIASLKERGLGLLLDVVPNHMSATVCNDWWLDILENGPRSRYATFFDIDWDPGDPELHGKILLPVLEDDYEKVLNSGKLRLARENGTFFVAYHNHKFPVDALTLPADALREPSLAPKQSGGALDYPSPYSKLDQMIQRQHYLLADWKHAATRINYRRFFDVSELVALKMELPEVFRATHELIFKWLASGLITGLRIDHPDGLRDPKDYLERLRKGAAERESPVYTIVEKILSNDESLPAEWPVDGTTGYDFLNRANGIFVNGENERDFNEIYREFRGNNDDFGQIVYKSRKFVLERSFAGELNALTKQLQQVAARINDAEHFGFSQLRQVLTEIVASFPVYRTYVGDTSEHVSSQDKAVISEALRLARMRAPAESAAADFIKRILLLETALDEAAQRSAREFVMKFQQLTSPVMAKGLEDTAFYRFNRLVSLNEVGGNPGKFGVRVEEFHRTNNAMAAHWPHTMLASATHDTKRGEDVRARLNVLSEMPSEWRSSIRRWSRLNANKKTALKHRAPDANDEYLLYQTLVGAWLPGIPRPSTFDPFRARIIQFMLKAVKEAKVNTSWLEPDEAYENALRKFVEGVLANDNAPFLEDLGRFACRVAFFGRINSLAQTLLKLTAPGVPDVYQGSELWDLNLVDPDNRRPVDFAQGQKILGDLKRKFGNRAGEDEDISCLLQDVEPGAMKLFLIWRVLNFRKAQRELFDSGDYFPLFASGEKREHVCAFARTQNGRAVIAVTPRLVFGLTNGAEVHPTGKLWGDTVLSLPNDREGIEFRNVLTGEIIRAVQKTEGTVLEMGQVLRKFPVALVERV